MVIHENLPPEDPLLENGADLDLNVEKETKLKMKYQVYFHFQTISSILKYFILFQH